LRSQVWRIGIGLLIVAVSTTIIYWTKFAPVDVRSHKVKAGEIVAEVMGTGILEARTKINISTKITGRITEILVDQGDEVNAGQVVARIDDHDLKHQVEVEEANVAAKRASLDRLTTDKTAAKTALHFATSNHERAQRLLASKTLSQEEFDRALDALNTAKAGMDRSEAAFVEGQKELIAAEKTLEFHHARLEDTVISAPFDGLIVRRDRDPGDVVVPGSSILYLVSLNEVWISAWVDETMQARITPGQPARVVFRSEPEVQYRGTVVRIGRETDPETREFLVDVQPDKLPQQWSVGQRAEGYIETERKSQATLVPLSFLVKRGEQTGVFVAVGGHAEWRPLTVGLQGRETMGVEGGLTPGEIVVAPAAPKAGPLTAGRRVRLP
jgi:HlyD family secretion protein